MLTIGKLSRGRIEYHAAQVPAVLSRGRGWVAEAIETRGGVENAAKIAMEHNLGLTCDPVGGLLRIPRIERNAIGAVKAVARRGWTVRDDGVGRSRLMTSSARWATPDAT